MLKCPVCQGSIKDDFGLIDCDHCGAPLIVHFDGSVEHARAESPNEARPDLSLPDEIPVLESGPLDLGGVEDATPQEQPVPEPEEFEPAAENVDFLSDEQQPIEQLPAESVVYRSEPAPNPADLSDLAAFGNADVKSGREGPLRYTLHISGIDTKDVREAFREALTDRKFVWDIDFILRSIKHGQVKIENATASKAYLLVVRLRNLPVQIRWEQYVVHQS